MGIPGQYGRRSSANLFLLLSVCCLTFNLMVSANIEPMADGNYCINKIPRRGVATNCTTDSKCEELLGVSMMRGNYLKCGEQGECITKQYPRNEFCKDACEKTECSKFCLQEYEAKSAMYCIETRDHPNVMPSGNGTRVMIPSKYFCTCVLTEEPYNHRVVSRYLKYKLFKV